jgi:hypothetical protein
MELSMDAEFANMFVQKQKDMINELVMKVLMLEARIAVMERAAQQAEATVQRIAELEEKNANLVVQLDGAEKDAIAKTKLVERLVAQKNELQTTVSALRQVAATKLAPILNVANDIGNPDSTT